MLVMMAEAHLEWFKGWERDVAADYARLHAQALKDPQRSGHGGESTWTRLLEDWLPPAYEVVEGRKYIVPEEGDDEFETDLIVFNPGYPRRLRAREEVMASGVAAAFSVKLTLDAAGLRDAVDRGARLRRAMKVREGSVRSEILGAFPFGLLAHSHVWKEPNSTPRANLASRLREYDSEFVEHPREALDLICVADLACGFTLRHACLGPKHVATIPEDELKLLVGANGGQQVPAAASTTTVITAEMSQPRPIATFVAALIMRLATADPSLRAFADGLRLTETLGTSVGRPRYYRLDAVYSEATRKQLPRRIGHSDDWHGLFAT